MIDLKNVSIETSGLARGVGSMSGRIISPKNVPIFVAAAEGITESKEVYDGAKEGRLGKQLCHSGIEVGGTFLGAKAGMIAGGTAGALATAKTAALIGGCIGGPAGALVGAGVGLGVGALCIYIGNRAGHYIATAKFGENDGVHDKTGEILDEELALKKNPMAVNNANSSEI